MIDFGALPPEINSANMYSGAGSAPLIAAACAWDTLAAELESYVADCSRVLAQLPGHAWAGRASVAMVSAIAPYLVWAATTAEQTVQAASMARAAASAYEIAFNATVPPSKITANRDQLRTLAADNFFGQHTAAIAMTENAYAEMWAQDAAAMYGYAASSAEATALDPFDYPPRIARTTEAAVRNGSSKASPGLGPDDWESLLLVAFAELNTLLFSPLQLIASLAETAFDTSKYGYAAKTDAESHDSTTSSTIAAGVVGSESSESLSARVHDVVLVRMCPVVVTNGPAVPWDSSTSTTKSSRAHKTPRTYLRAAPGQQVEPAATMPRGVRASGLEPSGPGARRRVGNAVFRMRDRRFKMPRPAAGG